MKKQYRLSPKALVKIVIFLAMVGRVEQVFAETKIEAWIKSARQEFYSNEEASYPRMILLTAGFEKEKPMPIKVDKKKFESIGFLKLADFDSLQFTYKLNDDVLNGSKTTLKTSTSEAFALFKELSGADSVLLAEGSPEEWRFYKDKKNGEVGEYNNEEKILEGSEEEAIYNWLFKTLGYDGIVVDVKGEYVLVASASHLLSEGGIQAMIIGDSEDKDVTSLSEREGSGLLKLVKSSGPYAIFKVVFMGKGNKKIARYSKVIIEHH